MFDFKKFQINPQYIFVFTCVVSAGIVSSLWSTPQCYTHTISSHRAKEILFRDQQQIQRRQLSQTAQDILKTAEAAISYNQPPHKKDAPVVMETEHITEKHARPSGENDTGNCVKTIHIFGDMELFRHVDLLKYFTGVLMKSEQPDFESDIDCVTDGYDCDLKLTIGADVSMIGGKDAVVFGMVGTQWRRNSLLQEVLEIEPEPGQTWIYYSTESPYRVVRWTESLDIARLKYHILMSYDTHSDIHIPFGYYKPFEEPEAGTTLRDSPGEEFFNRTHLIAWAENNCRDAFWPRMPLVTRLKELLPLDDYEACGELECEPMKSDKCSELFANYKFFLAIPNSECSDYITDKFWQLSLEHGLVPVVMGARKEDYVKVAPPNSFVHLADFKSIEALADHLKRVGADDNLYWKYHTWRSRGEIVTTVPLVPRTFCRTLPHLGPRGPGDIRYLGDSPWYSGCREAPSRKTIKYIYREVADWSVWR